LEPEIQQQIQNAQQQINDAASAVQACHAEESTNLRASLVGQVAAHAAAVEECQSNLEQLQTAETQQCAIAEDCLCDEARVRTQDQVALCTSVTETYVAAFCESHTMCTTFHQCHTAETEVYNSLRSDVEAEMAIIRQEYIAVQQSQCLTGLIMGSLASGNQIPHADLIACSNVDVSALNLASPSLPAEPAACPAPEHGSPECYSQHSTGEAEYIGCFTDSRQRDLSWRGWRDNAATNTFELCRSTCGDHTYMSLQSGGECYCGDAYGTDPTRHRQVDDSECNSQNEPCSSNSFNCGGVWRQAIYQIN
jgi:hypothetical protein